MPEDMLSHIIDLSATVGEVKSIVVANREASIARDIKIDEVKDSIIDLSETVHSNRHASDNNDVKVMARLNQQARDMTEMGVNMEALKVRVGVIEHAPWRAIKWAFGVGGAIGLALLRDWSGVFEHWPAHWPPHWPGGTP